MDWYAYLTLEFRLSRDAYSVNDKAVFDCPRCGITSLVRINHAKDKIKRLGRFECSRCRKGDSIARAREKRWVK